MSLISDIPSKHQEGFKLLQSIPEPTFLDIMDGLLMTQLCQSINKLAENVAIKKSLKQKDLERIFSTVGPLTFFLEKGIPIPEIVEDVSLAMERYSMVLDKEPKEQFQKRLTLLLNANQLYYATKATNLIEESNNVYIQARVVTDIRPIFHIDTKQPPVAGMIVHNLHIHYSSDDEGDHRDIYFALNSEEIKSLKNILIRAEDKEIGLKGVFQKSGLINLGE